jgi:hypothetical protein
MQILGHAQISDVARISMRTTGSVVVRDFMSLT